VKMDGTLNVCASCMFGGAAHKNCTGDTVSLSLVFVSFLELLVQKKDNAKGE